MALDDPPIMLKAASNAVSRCGVFILLFIVFVRLGIMLSLRL